MSARQDFTREYDSGDLPVDFAATLVLGAPQLPEMFEAPDGGDVSFKDGSNVTVTYTDLPAGYRAAVQVRKLLSSTGRVRVATNPMNAQVPSVPTSILPSQVAGIAADPNGIAAMMILRVPFTAATTGSADDVTVLASAPFAFRILDTFIYVSTAKGSATATLRSAAAGAGSALSDALSVNGTGVVRNTALTTSKTVAAEGALYLRRSDRDCAGELVLLIAKS